MNENSQRENLTIKVQKFFKDNIVVFAMLIVSVIYIFYGVVTIDKTGKTIDDIVAEGAISFLVGYTFKMLQSINGLLKGEQDSKFISTKTFYLSLLDETAPYQHYLPKYCDIENANALRRVQTAILRKDNIRYDEFINDTIDYSKLTKKQLKTIEKARNVEIAQLNDAILLSDSQVTIDSVKNLNVSKGSYLKFGAIKMALSMILFALLFGIYGIDPAKGFNWYGAIWSAMQIALYLVLGITAYFQSYMFMADTYRTALVRKSNHLERFKNMYKENPNRFKDEEDYAEININKVFEEQINKKEEIPQDGNNTRFEEQIPANGTK